jgi:hypothetical protein
MGEVLLFFFGSAGADEGFQFFGKADAVGLGQLHEAEGLEAALGGPHRKEHCRAGANAGGADVKQGGYLDAFIERVFEREQAPVDGELVQAGADLASVFEQHQGQHGAAKLDARAALSVLNAGSGHILCQYRMTTGQRGRLPKAFAGGRPGDGCQVSGLRCSDPWPSAVKKPTCYGLDRHD